ncbi:CRAL-TRIO domain-containing protein [Absidia repens]|uniref:CRAL-TRIO domain-containing protein n=1 Tax=Absidia repens TaxID=90262 RepID=A0A1X2HZ33_9FUNG|nr:CRAL-TRIO domain-containing protein [Absidia repens]
MDFHQRKLREVNELYSKHELTIEKLHAAVRREIPLLVQENQLTLPQIKALEVFTNDKLTLFRYLRKNNFSLPVALSLLLDTIQWRLKEQVGELTLTNVQEMLLEPLCFFHKYDRCGRPVLVIQLAYFPTFKDNTELLETVMPLVIFILETARKLLLDLTEQRIQQKQPDAIMADLVILVDFKNANSLPKDFTLVQTFIKLLKRYPGTAGMVCLLNFGWMYQGMWQMIKMILSQEAKNRVAFPKLKELKAIVDEDYLLSEFGGKDQFEWDLGQDGIFTRYQPKNDINYYQNAEETAKLIISSRRNSTSSIYYDTSDIFSVAPSSRVASSRRHQLVTPMTQLSKFSPSDPALPPPIYSRRPSASSASLYATPTGTLTPIAVAENSKFYSNNISATGRTKQSDIKSNGYGVDQDINRLAGNNQDDHGVSSLALSQRLETLQQQQRREAQSGHRRRKLWIKLVMERISTFEKKVIKLLLKYRFWIYCFALIWMLRKGLRLSQLPNLWSLLSDKHQHRSLIKWIAAPLLVSSRSNHSNTGR